MMTTPGKSEGPEVAASEPSEPIAPHQAEQEKLIMTQNADNPYPIDPTGPLTMGGIPDADLDRLVAATTGPEVVYLDGPEPAHAAWDELVASHPARIEHGGDAEKVIPFPRPAWADPARDCINSTVCTSYYHSEPVFVHARKTSGRNDADTETLTPAWARVGATLYGDGDPLVSLQLRKWDYTKDGERWAGMVVDFTPAEARELAAVLLAAADLATAEKADPPAFDTSRPW